MLALFQSLLLFVFLFFVSFTSLYAQNSREDARAIWERIYEKALVKLQFGTAKEKVKATLTLGTQGNPRFVRPLISELLRALNHDNVHLKTTAFGPFVKSNIAWSLGRIGHPAAVPGLLEALDRSIALARLDTKTKTEYSNQVRTLSSSQKKQAGQQNDKENRNNSQVEYILLEGNRPGPYQKKPDDRFIDNPDIFWSVADDFKTIVGGANPRYYSDHAVGLKGSNYWNLARAILIALGEIASQDSIEKLSSYLDANNYPIKALRVFASYAIRSTGGVKAVEAIQKYFADEKEPRVKLAMAYSILRIDRTKSEMYSVLVNYLKEPDRRLRLAAAQAFQELGMGEALEDLRNAHMIEADIHIRSVLEKGIKKGIRNTLLPRDLR